MKGGFDTPQRFPTAGGRTVYAFSLEVFPAFFGNLYVVSDGERRLLVDCGSGLDSSNRGLVAALEAVSEQFGEPVALDQLDGVLITHAHMDHFGGLGFVRQQTDAPIGVHPLDRRVLSHYEERLVVASTHLRRFLESAGLSDERCRGLMQMYGFAKHHYRSVETQFPLDEGEPVLGARGEWDLEVVHAPGHCPGQVCVRVDDVLLTADHVLARTSPHQSPESITLNMGLGHYLDSLRKLEGKEGIRLALGGHEAPIEDLEGRLAEIRALHRQRLDHILEHCREPATTAEVSRQLFGKLRGYNVLLALEEAGAHVEYLHQRGELVVANVEELEREERPVLRYVAA